MRSPVIPPESQPAGLSASLSVSPPVRLQNGRLALEIADGDSLFTRFDRTGTVGQISLAGGGTFLTRESDPAGGPPGEKDGFGLACEFGLDGPVGWETPSLPLPEGRLFLKPGVGWLRADGASYSFMKRYALEAPGTLTRSSGEGWLESCWDAGPAPSPAGGPGDLDCGYGCRYRRRIALEEGGLSIRCTLWNTGALPFTLSEYCHNFLSLDGSPFPGDYRLRLLAGEGAPRWESWDGLLRFERYPGYRAYPAAEPAGEGAPDCRRIRGWELSRGGRSISEQVDFPVDRFALWSMAHVASPELFVRFSLEPGRAFSWTRRYRIAKPAEDW